MYFQIYLGLCAKWQMADYTISNQTGADPGFFLGGGAALRDGVTDR